MMMPSSTVTICAERRLFTRCVAHSAKAAEPPALFMRATMVPSMTRKMSMPTFQLSAMECMMPYDAALSPSPTVSLSRCMMKPSRPVPLPMAKKTAPMTTPMKREEYTSLVMRASVMATMLGTSDQNVPIII